MLPEGTVTFFRSDVEGSMELVRSLGPRYDDLNADHQGIVRRALGEHGGHVVRTEGDAFLAVFSDATGAARAALAVQQAAAAHAWPEGQDFRVRIGLHSGLAYRAGDDYGGFEVNRASRIASMGWGGQVILSDPVRALIVADMPDGWTIRDLGRHRLKGVPEPERIFQLEAPGLRTEFPALRSASGDAGHLPVRLTTFVGREAELDALGTLLESTRLLTLTGPGGTGKTTLALELARRRAADFEDGAWFVDFEAVRDPSSVRAEIAHGLGLLDGAAGPAAERLTGYVSDRELLLVIDNFEQVVGAAGAIGGLLVASPRSRVIVTSRVPLRLGAEQEFAVRPLTLQPASGDGESEAVRLYIDRARRVRPDLSAGDRELETIRDTCRLVDGLPLAIELCAARASTLPLGLIHDRLASRLPLPGSGPRDLPDRQRTIEDTVAWSHDLLDEPLQALFARLAVFPGSFDLEQAESVCGPAEEIGTDVLDGLVRLAEQSLLQRVDDLSGGVRFAMLETIRAYASNRLDTSGAGQVMRERHVRAYADLAERASRFFPGSEQGHWLDRLEPDDANLRAATAWAISARDVELALRLTSGLWRYWLMTGRLAEGRELIRAALSLPGAEAATALRARALDAAGGVAYWSGDVPRATAFYEEELALAQGLGDAEAEALAWLDLAFARDWADESSGALAAKEQAETLYRQLGDEFGLGRVDMIVMMSALVRGVRDPEAVVGELEAAIVRFEACQDPWLRRTVLGLRAILEWIRGDLAMAARWLVRGLRANLEFRESGETALAMQFFVASSRMMGLAATGALAYGAILAEIERLGIEAPASQSDFIPGIDPLTLLSEALGRGGFDEAVQRGRRLSIEEAVDLIEDALGPAPA